MKLLKGNRFNEKFWNFNFRNNKFCCIAWKYDVNLYLMTIHHNYLLILAYRYPRKITTEATHLEFREVRVFWKIEQWLYFYISQKIGYIPWSPLKCLKEPCRGSEGISIFGKCSTLNILLIFPKFMINQVFTNNCQLLLSTLTLCAKKSRKYRNLQSKFW